MTEQTISPAHSQTRSGFITALRQPTFLVLWLSEALSLIGDRLVIVALVTLVYERTHSPIAVGILMMFKAVPALALGSLAGVFVDRWNRKWVMVASNLIQGLLVLLIPISDSLLLLFTAYLAMSIVNQFFVPARAATLPTLVPLPALMAANSLFAAAFVGAIAIGPAIGGWIVEHVGVNAAFYVDAATFLIPALAVGVLTIPQARRSLGDRRIGADLSQGLAFARSRTDILTALILIAAAFLIMGTISVLGVMIADSLHVGAGGFGLMMSAMGVGMLCGAVFIGWLGQKIDRKWLGIAGIVIMGLTILALTWVTRLNLATTLLMLNGFGMVTVQASSQSTLQSISDELRGRVMGLSQTLTGGVQFLAAALAGLLAEQLGAATVLSGVGLIAIAAGFTIMLQKRQVS
jgi:MFS family permease